MEKPIYPLDIMRITQGYNEGTHVDSYAIDDGGKDYNISNIRAPFTGIIKKIYKDDANEVWLESIDKVEYPDGTIDYMTIMFAHCNDISKLFVGKIIKQNEVFYQEGTKGNATGNHCHMECGKGKFTGTGWHKNKGGYYSINNGKKPEECLWIDDNIKILYDKGYIFKKININEKNEIKVDKDIIEKYEKIESPIKLIYTCKKSDYYAIYLNENEKIYIEPK